MLKVARKYMLLTFIIRKSNHSRTYSCIYSPLNNRTIKANHVLGLSNYLQVAENYSQSHQELSQALAENSVALFYNQNSILDRLADPFVNSPEEDKEYLMSFLDKFIEHNYSSLLEDEELRERIEYRNVTALAFQQPNIEELEETIPAALSTANIPFGINNKTSQLLAPINIKDQQAKSKQFNLNQYLQAYVDAMVYKNDINEISKATNMVLNYLKRVVQGKLIKDPNIFNPIFKILAIRNKDPNAIYKFIQTMVNNDIEPNIQSFAALLHSCDSEMVSIQMIDYYIKCMQSHGFQIEDLATQCKLTKIQQASISNVLKRVSQDPFFPKSYTKASYNSPLLKGLNEPNSMRENFSPKSPLLSAEQLKTKFSQQLEIEKSGSQTIKSINKPQDTKESVQMRHKIKQLEESWEYELGNKFNIAIDDLKLKSMNKNTLSIYPYLVILKPEQYVKLMMKEIRSVSDNSEYFSYPATIIYKDLGIKVMNTYKAQVKVENGVTEKMEEIYKEYTEYYNNPILRAEYNPREYWSLLLKKYPQGATLVQDDICWPYPILVAIGKFLYDLIENTINFKFDNQETITEKVFTTVYRRYGYKIRLEIKPSPALCKLYRNVHREDLEFNLTEVPMICPPIPWMNSKLGSYLTMPTNFIRLQEQAIHQINLIDNYAQDKLYSIFDSLNVLSSCPWKINKPMLDVVKHIFLNKGNPDISIPCHPSNMHPFEILEGEEAKGMSLKKQKDLRDKLEAESYSLWCNTLYQLSMADHYKDEVFWLPHNLDFRGRVYPTPPFLSHIGCDLARSILLFAEGKPLGPNGLNWLKLHLVNLEGEMKKASLKERLAYAEKILPEIFDSANHPLEGRQWWTKADDPLQALACCKEIVNVMQSSDHQNYISHYPIHQDGSCNGLQHYSALGRDELGAEHVNLSDREKPGDVYTGVANLVEKSRKNDAADESSPNHLIANKLDGFVSRKVVKQTVMTTVYGVTQYGARQQIRKQLKDLNLDEESVGEGSKYIQGLTFGSISTIFNSARKLQNWLTISAKIISKFCDKPVKWITPLGLPVVQPYHKPRQVMPACLGLDKSFKVSYENKTNIYELPNTRKQANAFPPNYIHSLDSTHMMLTALYCWRAGITFVSVHDCFWTHAQDVETMNKICREQFVSMHSQPLLEELSKYFLQEYGFPIEEYALPEVETNLLTAKKNINEFFQGLPVKGNFDLVDVLKSKYFFS